MAIEKAWKEKIAQAKEILYNLGFSKEEAMTALVLTGNEPKLTKFLTYLKSGEYDTLQDIRNKAAEIAG